MNRQLLQEAHDAIEAFTDPKGNMPEDTGEFRGLSKVLIGLKAALSQPAPQGVAEVLELVDELVTTRFVEGIDGDDVATEHARMLVEQAITAIVQERDALKARNSDVGGAAALYAKLYHDLKARVAELEGDVARDAARYRWLIADLTGAAKYLRDELLDRMSVMSYSSACTDIDAASKEAP